MAWTNWPPVSGTTDVQAYDFLIQLWKACRERAWALGVEFFPRTNVIWDSGTIDSLVQSGDGTWTLTDSDKDWQPNATYCTGDRWTNYVCEELPYIPRYYDVLIDFNRDDPRTSVRAQISANTPNTLHIADMSDYVTAGLIPSVSSLVGKRYFIIKRNGLWWSDRNEALGRWLDWPNDQELDKGFVATSTTTTLTINDPHKRWSVNEWAGKHLLVYAGGKLVRRAISSNTADTLTFSAMPDASGGAYVIVAAGGKALPGKTSPAPFWWYGGAPKAYWSHLPDDQIGVTNAPATYVSWSSGTIGFCEDQSHAALDVDLWSEVTEECSEADKCYSPKFFKTLRSIQLWLEGVCSGFVEAKNYDGAGAIPNFTTATWFKAAAINAGTSSVAGPDGEGNYYFNAPSGYEGVLLYWTALKSNGDVFTSGTGGVMSGKVILGTDENLAGKSIVYSAGWTRYHAREFTYMYERAAFIPDVDSSLLGAGPIDPPEVSDFEEGGCFGVGMWVKRGPSTAFRVFNEYGFPVDGESFQTGDVARYVGDNWHDTGTGILDPVEVSLSRPSGMSPDLPYWDRLYEGQHPKPPYGNTQKLIVADRFGVSTSGTNRSLTDTAKNWWNPHWYNGGVLRTESGTATGGSSTHLQIEAFKVDPEDERHCFWQSERLIGFTGPYVEFILEVDKVVAGQTVTTKLPITGVSGRNVQFAGVPGFSVNAGDAYRIREPKYNLNRYKGKTLRLVDPATRATHDVVITHSDDNSLFFAPQSFTVGADWSYEIIEHDTGGVWKWDGTKWTKPVGNDPRGVPWHDDQTENLPHKVKRFGRIMKGDYIAFHVFDELYRAINVLRWTKAGASWRSCEDGVTEECSAYGLQFAPLWDINNDCTGLECCASTFDRAVAIIREYSETCFVYGRDCGTMCVTYPPKAITQAQIDAYSFPEGTSTNLGYIIGNLQTQSGYMRVEGVPTFMNSQIQFMFFSSIAGLPPGADEVDVTTQTYSESPYPLTTNARTKAQFNAYGTPAKKLKWASLGAEPADPTGSATSTRLGSAELVQIADVEIPPPDYSGGGNVRSNAFIGDGFYVSDQLAIVKWDVAGGMVFVD